MNDMTHKFYYDDSPINYRQGRIISSRFGYLKLNKSSFLIQWS